MTSVKFRLLTLTQNQMLRLGMLKAILRMKEKIKRNKNRSSNCRPQQKSKQRLQQLADYKPGERLKEGKQIFILLSIQMAQQKVDHEIVFPPSGSNSTQQLYTLILWG